MSLENLLREVLADVAAEVAPAPAPDRAAIAVAGVRRRRRATALAAAVLVLAGALVVPAVRPDPARLPAGTPAPGPTSAAPSRSAPAPNPRSGPQPVPLPPLPVVVGLDLTAAARTGPYQLTSVRTAAGVAIRPPGAAVFRRLPWQQASVSPTGRIAVVDTTDATPGGRVGVIDDLTGGVRWQSVGLPALHPVWSPDGRTVLVTTLTADGRTGQRDGAALLDTVTWTVRQIQLDDAYADSGLGGMALSWDPGGGALVGPADRETYGGEPEFGLRWWDLTGAVLRTVPLPGRPGSANSQVVSPSGARAAASTGQGVVVVDTRNGQVLARPPAAVSAVYGWRDESHVVAAGAYGLVLLGLDGSTSPYATGTGDAGVRDAGVTRADR